MSSSAPPTARRRGQLGDLHVLRYVPVESPVHRAWAGTKIGAVVVLTFALLLWPTWQAAGLGVVVVLGGGLVARLPRGILPHLPRVVYALFGLGAVIALVSGGGRPVHLGDLSLRLGGLDQWARFSLIGLDLLGFAALVTWTTPLADLAPALGRLLGPLRHLRVPVDEVVGAIALSVRCLPLLIDETRMLLAASRTRLPVPPASWKERSRLVEDLMLGGLASALRRARELAEAIEARGGVPAELEEPHRLAPLDGLLIAVVAAVAVAMALL